MKKLYSRTRINYVESQARTTENLISSFWQEWGMKALSNWPVFNPLAPSPLTSFTNDWYHFGTHWLGIPLLNTLNSQKRKKFYLIKKCFRSFLASLQNRSRFESDLSSVQAAPTETLGLAQSSNMRCSIFQWGALVCLNLWHRPGARGRFEKC